jgi:isocitrate/isopropylmalate dehydrogenase
MTSAQTTGGDKGERPMALVNTLKIYEMLRPQFKDESAKTIAKAIENSLEEFHLGQKEVLATKEDLATTKTEIIKWMFIFWVGQVGVMTGLFAVFLRR